MNNFERLMDGTGQFDHGPDPTGTCTKCRGRGEFLYPTTLTWIGWLSGQVMTDGTGTCDRCWGSGDEDAPGEDLRLRWMEERRAVWLGASGECLRPVTPEDGNLDAACAEWVTDNDDDWETLEEYEKQRARAVMGDYIAAWLGSV